MISAQLDETMLALSDPTRRAIMERLSRGEARITDLARPFDMSLNAVSKHILILERAHLVRRRREGREHLLIVNPEPLDDAISWIEHYRKGWEERFDRLDAYLKELQANERKESDHKGKKNGHR